jgi:hypothetical protein
MALTVLLCYAREDERLAKRLKEHLSLLERNKLIVLRDYGDINPGTDRERNTQQHFNEAHIILLLISHSFISSDYCYNVEIQLAIDKHERIESCVIPVILRSCHWKEPPLDKLQPLPNEGKPIVNGKDPNKGFKKVVDALAKVVKQWNHHTLPGPEEKRRMLITNLNQLSETVKKRMHPPARANATACTLKELSVYIPVEVTLADLITGWRVLSRSNNVKNEHPAILQRRSTCSELADIASQLTTETGNLAHATKTWDIWQNTLKYRNDFDPRHMAMANTFTRELIELKEAAHF